MLQRSIPFLPMAFTRDLNILHPEYTSSGLLSHTFGTGYLFRLGLSSESLIVGLGEGLDFTLLAVLYPEPDSQLKPSSSH